MYFLEHLFFSNLHGGWPRYYTTTDKMKDRSITDTFHIFRVFKRLPESLIKIWGIMLMG